MAWNESATDYVLAEDLEIRSPTNEELGRNGAILAVVSGTHFVPGGLSRNKRFYPEDKNKFGCLWGEQLQRPWVVEKMANNTMCGTIGHDTEIGEKEFREGKVSHFTKGLKIIATGDPKKPYKGYAESYILNTDAGRALKTYLDAGLTLFVSSRADGDFLPGATYKVAEDGSEVPVLDPAKFRLERFDFVLNPGFFDAHPTLKESARVTEEMLKSINEAYRECEKHLSENSIKENVMSGAEGNELINKSAGDVVIKVTDDNAISIEKVKSVGSKADRTQAPYPKGATASVSTDKDGAAEDTFGDKEQNTLTEAMISDLLKRNEELEAKVKLLQEAVASDAKPDVKDLTQTMLDANLKKMDPQGVVGNGIKRGGGSLDDLVSALKKVESWHAEMGDPDSVREAVFEMANLIRSAGGAANIVKDILFHEEYGTPDELADTFAVFGKFSEEVGTPDEILDRLNGYHDVFETLGTPDDIADLVQTLRAICERHGTLEEVVQKLDDADAMYEFFDGCGSPAEIEAGLRMMDAMTKKLESLQSLGVDNVTELKTLLMELQETKLKNQALAIAEHTGLNSEVVEGKLREGFSEKQIVDMYNKASDNYYGRYLTVREDLTGSHLDKIPLKTVDSDGNHVQLTNATWKVDVHENTSSLDRVLSRVQNAPVFGAAAKAAV